MAEIVSDVFDVACPSPLSLQELSSLAIIEELWREKIRSYHRKCTIGFYELLYYDFLLVEELPNIPRRIEDLLEKYVNRLRDSLTLWLYAHDHSVFRTVRKSWEDWNKILSVFHDVALDWNGTIHYVRTAKRMLLCDRIDIDKKFRIACLYCFEDDIKRIWPSVCTKMDLNKISFYELPQVYYWTCLLRNELHKVPNLNNIFDKDVHTAESMMFYLGESKNYSCATYFWNRVPLERLSQTFILKVSYRHLESFHRYILPKLSEAQLLEYVAARGDRLRITHPQLVYLPEERELVIPTSTYVRNKIGEKTFVALTGSEN